MDGGLIAFTGAAVVSERGLMELADGSLLAEPVWDILHVSPSALWRRRFRPRVRQKGPWFSCLLHYANRYYYHWICDVLPRFHRVLDHLPANTKFLVPWGMKPFQWEALAAIGVDRSRCVPFPPGRAWVFDELYYAPPAAPVHEHNAAAIGWVRDTVMASLGIERPPATETHLYVTRRLSDRRRMANEAALWPTLAAVGFEMVDPECMTFAQQVRTFSQACSLVGPHGGGLTNMMWCPRTVKVAEIMSPAVSSRGCFWSLASALGLEYAAAMGRDMPGTKERDIACAEASIDEIVRWISSGAEIP